MEKTTTKAITFKKTSWFAIDCLIAGVLLPLLLRVSAHLTLRARVAAYAPPPRRAVIGLVNGHLVGFFPDALPRVRLNGGSCMSTLPQGVHDAVGPIPPTTDRAPKKSSRTLGGPAWVWYARGGGTAVHRPLSAPLSPVAAPRP
jgi:hypothetical protein